MPERIEEYLKTAGEQIRWKRAKEPLMRELRCHLLEQRDEYIRSGMSEEEAERQAVQQMGDAETVGQELDGVHKPTPQWGLLIMVGIVSLFGCALRGFDGRAAVYTLLGFALMLGLYFLDYTFLAKHGKALYVLTLAVSLAVPYISPNVGGRIYYLQYVVLFYPVVYVFFLSSLRSKGLGCFILAVLSAAPLMFFCLIVPTILGAGILAVSVAVTLITAAVKGWFAVSKRVMAAVLTFALGVPVLLVGVTVIRHWDGVWERVSIALNPYLDPRSKGYDGVILREMLSKAQLWGESASEMWFRMPNKTTDFLLASLLEGFGWVPFVTLLLVLAGIVVLGAVKCFKERGTLQRLIGTAVLLTIGLQMLSSVTANLGVVFIVGTCPFVGRTAHSAVDMALMGILMSVLRTSKLPQCETAYTPEPMHLTNRISYADGELVIRLKTKQ